MRKCMLIILILQLLIFPLAVAGAEETTPLEQLILQQHLTQKELERNLSLIKAEEQKLQSEIAQLDIDLKRQELVIDAMRRRAGEVARAYYTGERASFLTLLFDAKDFNQFLMMFDFLQLLYNRDMDQMERFQAERTKSAAMQADKHARLSRIQVLRANFERQLAEMLAVQREKEKNLQQISDPTTVEALMTHLISDWKERGLPAFQNFFGVLAKVMIQVPELATPDRITSDGLLSHTLTINQTDFNQFLMSKNDLFKQSTFSFANNELVVEGTYDQLNLRIVGDYQLVSPKELKFHIKKLYFDGFELPKATIEEMEKAYDLGFYPSLISPNIEVQSITLANEELKLQLKLDLPFGFGTSK